MGVGVHLGNPALAHSAPPGLVQTCSLWSPYFYRQAGGWPSTERPSCYHPPTKLWEGNIFTGVCDSIQRGPLVTITHDAMNLTVQSPTGPRSLDIRPGTPSPSTLPPATDIWWSILETCSNCSLEEPPPRKQNLVVATEVRTVCKQVVRILLECFLVTVYCHRIWLKSVEISLSVVQARYI